MVPLELVGSRGTRDLIHSRAEAMLVSRLPASPRATPIPVLMPYPESLDDAYGRVLFHGEDLAGIERIDGVSETAIVGWCKAAPPPSAWLRQPLRSAWITNPLALDAAFQLLILWSTAVHGAGCLPCRTGRISPVMRRAPSR